MEGSIGSGSFSSSKAPFQSNAMVEGGLGVTIIEEAS